MFLLRRAFLRWMVVRCAEDRLAVQWARMAYVAATDTGLIRLAARAAALMSMSLMAGRDWAGADRLLTRNLDVLRAAGDAQGTAMARNLLGITMIELDRPGEAAEHLVEAIGEARRCDDRLAEVTAAWAVSFLACRLGRHADAALAVDAVAGNGRLLERALPAPVVDDSRRAFEASPRQEPAPAGESAIQGWGWLSGWAVGIATEIATDHASAADPPFALGPVDQVDQVGPVGALAPIGSALRPGEPATVGVPAPLTTLASAAPMAAGRPATITTGDRVVTQVLTARELEILTAIASGRTNAQIASDFFLSTKTVMHHSVSIYRKLEVRGRAEAVALAYRSGLLQAPFG